MTTQPKTPTPATARHSWTYTEIKGQKYPDSMCRRCGIQLKNTWPGLVKNPSCIPKSARQTFSACSSSHPEIRYKGETCPLCEALSELAPHRERRSEQLKAAGISILASAHQKTCPRKPFPGWLNCTECFIAEHTRALSRHSSDQDGETK